MCVCVIYIYNIYVDWMINIKKSLIFENAYMVRLYICIVVEHVLFITYSIFWLLLYF